MNLLKTYSKQVIDLIEKATKDPLLGWDDDLILKWSYFYEQLIMERTKESE